MDLPQKIHVYHSILYSGKKAGVFIYLFAKDKEVPIIDYRYGTCIMNGGCCSDASIVVYNNVMSFLSKADWSFILHWHVSHLSVLDMASSVLSLSLQIPPSIWSGVDSSSFPLQQ